VDVALLRVFQRQVYLQLQALMVAVHDFNGAMTTGDTRHAWIAIQNILTAAANVSKALWGSKGKRAVERVPLRASLQIEDTSPLRDVVMRNHFEHYDERLDTWWDESNAHNHFDMVTLELDAGATRLLPIANAEASKPHWGEPPPPDPPSNSGSG
jgi:hypothetical protein